MEKGGHDGFITDVKENKRRLACLYILSGDTASRSRAVRMVSTLEDSRDTLAIRRYLDAICHVLNDDAGDDVIDSLVDLAADRGFPPAIATRLCSISSEKMTGQKFEQLWKYGMEVPESIYSKSSEIAYLIADMCVRSEAFPQVSGGEQERIFYRCLKYTPREYTIQFVIGQFFNRIAHKQGETTIMNNIMDYVLLKNLQDYGWSIEPPTSRKERKDELCLFDPDNKKTS